MYLKINILLHFFITVQCITYGTPRLRPRIVDYLATCDNEQKCNETKNLFCSKTEEYQTNVCICLPGFVFSDISKLCVGIVGAKCSPEISEEFLQETDIFILVPNKPCVEHAFCSANGECKCDVGFSEMRKRCAANHKVECAENECNSDLGLECGQSGQCECAGGSLSIFSPYSQSCVSKVGGVCWEGKGCVEGAVCLHNSCVCHSSRTEFPGRFCTFSLASNFRKSAKNAMFFILFGMFHVLIVYL